MPMRPGEWNGARCPICGEGTLHDAVRSTTVEYRGVPFRDRERGAYCDACGDGMAYHDAAAEQRWRRFRQGVLDAQRRELAELRARLGLTQLQASRLTGGGHNAFSRYERGEAVPVMAVQHLLRVLARHPELLADIDPSLTAVSSGVGQLAARRKARAG